MWGRFLAGSVVIVVSVAAATSIGAFAFLTGFVVPPEIRTPDLPEPDAGAAQTILVLGSDERPEEEKGRSDTAVLARIDPDRDLISLLSIPRDLRVEVPGQGRDRFNAAYSYGGPGLALEVARDLTGVEINHVVNIDFTGFAEAVDAINCVFVDVDRRYYVPEGSEYSAIDPPIEAGYQRLCGLKALQYTRYRLEDNDLVRAARQQDFIREARQKIDLGRLLLDTDYRRELLDVFRRYTSASEGLGSITGVIKLLRTLGGASDAVVDEVHFPARLGESYVTAGDERIRVAVAEFEGEDRAAVKRRDARGGGRADPGRRDPGRRGRRGRDDRPEPPPMDDARGQAESYATSIAEWETRGGEAMIRFAVEYPTRLAPGSTVTDESRAFPIDGPREHRGYKLVVSMPGSGTGLTTEYYGVSGTDWRDPPLLDNPSEKQTIDGREYLLFYDGDRLRQVAWRTGEAAYWVSNSLLQSLDEAEMLAIATSTRELER